MLPLKNVNHHARDLAYLLLDQVTWLNHVKFAAVATSRSALTIIFLTGLNFLDVPRLPRFGASFLRRYDLY